MKSGGRAPKESCTRSVRQYFCVVKKNECAGGSSPLPIWLEREEASLLHSICENSINWLKSHDITIYIYSYGWYAHRNFCHPLLICNVHAYDTRRNNSLNQVSLFPSFESSQGALQRRPGTEPIDMVVGRRETSTSATVRDNNRELIEVLVNVVHACYSLTNETFIRIADDQVPSSRSRTNPVAVRYELKVSPNKCCHVSHCGCIVGKLERRQREIPTSFVGH